MSLPDVQRGMAILAEHIQRINAAIRQSKLQNGVGYFVKQTNGGTSLVIQPGLLGGGGGAAALPCPFECTDASDEEGLKVQVAWGLIWQMLPTGMFPDNDPPLKLTVTANCYIYSKITFDVDTLLPTAISFTVETDLASNTATEQYNLIASVFVDTSTDPATITEIRNVCQQPFPSPCALA